MFAVKQYEFGSPDTLRPESVPDPVPGADQVLIDVEAAGVHLVDTSMRSGDEGKLPWGKPTLPLIPGREVAGTIAAVGRDVDPAMVGSRVVTHLGFAHGGYASRAVREAAALHEIGPDLDSVTAVAMIGTGRTAVSLLHSVPLSERDGVIVTAAAGGLGNLLVQAAKRSGAFVIGLAGGKEKTELVDQAGADLAIDYRQDDWARTVRDKTQGRQLTTLFDGVGGTIAREAFHLLSPGGRAGIFGWSSGTVLDLHTTDIVDSGVTLIPAIGPHTVAQAGGLRALETEALRCAREGYWTPLVTSFPLSDADKAHEALENRATTGKVVLRP
ncbi:zinc-binding dehydrogenase [Haloglycomyces albus]|uniref:zinc-binding dehydrogenase n=1 Tax=Haloglycomyces albus TaxID=526067 RepID=UPI00046D6790|nr:zinc-binding dehydrogenase [Haloglycomyces albus]